MKVVYRKGWVKIQQMYENLKFDLHLKLLFNVTGAYYESGLYLLRLADFMTVISSLMEAVCVAWNLKTFEALTE